MPELARFGSWKILMFFQDENPPHVHLAGPNFAAKMRISDGSLLAGRVPARELRRARLWVEAHRAELSELWAEFEK